MGTNLYNVYEEDEDNDFYRFFNEFYAETYDTWPYGPTNSNATIRDFRTTDYDNDTAELFFYCFFRSLQSSRSI